MQSDNIGSPDTPDSPKRVAFDYIKGQHFRVIHADGVLGSLTPGGNLHMAIFSERAAIPRRQVYELKDNGELGQNIPSETVSRNSVVREIDVDVTMTVATAEAMLKWLQQMIDLARSSGSETTNKTGGS